MLDEETYTFYISNGEGIYLGKISTELLSHILNNKNRYTPYDELIKLLWGSERTEKTDNRLKENVYKINKKLKGEVSIVSKFGVGYILGTERKKDDGRKRKKRRRRNRKLVQSK